MKTRVQSRWFVWSLLGLAMIVMSLIGAMFVTDAINRRAAETSVHLSGTTFEVFQGITLACSVIWVGIFIAAVNRHGRKALRLLLILPLIGLPAAAIIGGKGEECGCDGCKTYDLKTAIDILPSKPIAAITCRSIVRFRP